MPKAKKSKPSRPKNLASTPQISSQSIAISPGIEAAHGNAHEVVADIAPETAVKIEAVKPIIQSSFWSSFILAQWFRAGLWLLLLGGLALRFVGVMWDDNFHLHPDERFLTMVVPELRWPQSFAAWFHTQAAPHNPFNIPNTNLFVYGQFPLLWVKAVAARFDADSYDGVLKIGRIMSALFDVGSVGFLWLIARRLLGGMWAEIAAILLAFGALHLQHAHFFVVDTFATFWIVVAFWSALKWLDATHSHLQVLADDTANTARSNHQRARFKAIVWALICGLSWGLALACKISAMLFAPVLLGFWLAAVAPIFKSWRARKSQRSTQETSFKSKRRAPVWLGAMVLIFGAVLAFRCGHPMAFRGESAWWSLGGLLDLRLPHDATPNFWKSVVEQRDITNGTRDVPWNLQWFGRQNYVWPLRNLMIWAIGWQQLLPAIGAMAWMLLRWLRGQSLANVNVAASKVPTRATDAGLMLAALWTLWVFVYHAGQFSKFSRYFLLMTPFVALLAAWCAQQLWQRARRVQGQILADELQAPESTVQVLADEAQTVQKPNFSLSANMSGASWAALLVSGVMLSGTVLWGACVASIYTRPHTRVAASRWLQTLPDGTVLANESAWDDTLPLDDKSRFQMLDMKLLEREDAPKRTALLDTLELADYIVISSPRLWGTIPRIEPRLPLTTRFYHALFRGELGFVPHKQWTSYPTLNLLGLSIPFADDTVEEALTVYDHPRVVIFRKTANWSKQNAAQILDATLLDAIDEAPLSELKARGVKVDESALPQLPSP